MGAGDANCLQIGDGNRLRQIHQECGSLQLQSECEELGRKMGFRF